MFPYDVSRGRVGADDFLALIRSLCAIMDNGVELAAKHDRSRSTGELLLLPKQIAAGAAVRIPLINESFFCGDAILLRPTPIWPIHRIDVSGKCKACETREPGQHETNRNASQPSRCREALHVGLLRPMMKGDGEIAGR